ncbi:MlaE family ABC transporter permease [Chenggangzhangella methanolivorans]|uniref:ABC transporter permease n=1 Tax=Chenggangzhangella methanolivorans TaxID=1437009 RepID=A0A9E6UMS6_9HYPH|nr:ABC transporter permease [Chenggangzhangella methanolivorans]QZN99478.1 ABC transporter permease [Chenggangzhangella methanolivorans]
MAIETDVADLKVEAFDEGLVLTPLGPWTAQTGDGLETRIDRLDLSGVSGRRVAIDMGEIERLDTVGALLLERLRGAAEAAGASSDFFDARPQHERLMTALREHGKEPPVALKKPIWPVAFVEGIGRSVCEIGDDVSRGLGFLGAVVAVSGRLALTPWRFRFTSTIHHLDRVGVGAVPIIALISFLVGAIVAQQSIFQLKNFGATLFVVDLLGILVLRELGVLLTAIMIAGRSGSAFTAEIGSMKMREEIDALKTMGLDSIEILALPRLVALVIALPMLSFIASMAALLGGGLVAWVYGDITPVTFLQRLKDALTLQTFMVGLIKAPFMAIVIGLIACTEGMKVEGSAESLGSRTTASVVKAIFVVIVLDGVFAMFFAGMGI